MRNTTICKQLHSLQIEPRVLAVVVHLREGCRVIAPVLSGRRIPHQVHSERKGACFCQPAYRPGASACTRESRQRYSLSIKSDKPWVGVRVVDRGQTILQRQRDRPVEIFVHPCLRPLGRRDNVHGLVHEYPGRLPIVPSENLASVSFNLVILGGWWQDTAFFHDLQHARRNPFGVSIYTTERDRSAVENR